MANLSNPLSLRWVWSLDKGLTLLFLYNSIITLYNVTDLSRIPVNKGTNSRLGSSRQIRLFVWNFPPEPQPHFYMLAHGSGIQERSILFMVWLYTYFNKGCFGIWSLKSRLQIIQYNAMLCLSDHQTMAFKDQSTIPKATFIEMVYIEYPHQDCKTGRLASPTGNLNNLHSETVNFNQKAFSC